MFKISKRKAGIYISILNSIPWQSDTPVFVYVYATNQVRLQHTIQLAFSMNMEWVIVNDDQLDATILAYLFIPNQLFVFRAMSSPIIRSI